MKAALLTVRVSSTKLSEQIEALIDDAEAPDAQAVSKKLLAELQGDELDAAIQRGLRLLVEHTVRKMRRDATRHAREDVERQESERKWTARRNASAEILAAATEEHRLRVEARFFSSWKETATGRKFLGECTVDDLRFSRDKHRARSDEALAASSRDERLALALDEAGVQIVRELGYDAAAAAFVGAS
jgi:hypothetical protein